MPSPTSTSSTASSLSFAARVRVKKRDGQLVLGDKGLRWTPDETPVPGAENGDGRQQHEASKPLVVSWASIQDQQVSSATSPRAMIRLRLTNGVVVILEFPDDRGLEEAFELRDQAKDLIALGLQRHQKSTSGTSATAHGRHQTTDRTPLCNAGEIKHRAALLASNPTLKRQHTEMVNQGLISEEDFWASRRQLLANEASKRQKTGKTSAILTDLTGDNDTGGNVIKYNLNAEVIHQIFIQYPAVHLAYTSHVPDKLSETEFWGAFFKSKYFHRDRNKAGHEDLFTKFEEREREMARENAVDPRGIVDPLVDLTATAEDRTIHKAVDRSEVTTAKGSSSADADANLTIAKFNRHGAYVLDPAHAGKLLPSTDGQLKKPAVLRSQSTAQLQHSSLQEATRLDDLEAKPAPDYNPLTIEDDSKYFQHSDKKGAGTASSSQQQQQSPASFAESTAQFHTACSSTIALDRAFPPARTSMSVLAEIISHADSGHDATASSTASLVSGALAADCIPNEFKKQVYTQFHDVCELLRHFLSFKAKAERGGDPEAKHKLKRIVERMESKYDELVKIREALPPHEKNLLAPLLKPFDDQLNLAFI